LDRLDYLESLGITAVYFNPLFESPSLHKYDASMFHHIDNNFGPDPVQDRQIWEEENPGDPSTWQWTTADKLFLDLIEECHRRGIKIIVDGVFNHTGVTFWAFQDIVENQQNSPYKDWFVIKALDDPATPENEFEYEGWNGVKDLPEFREDENGLVSGPRQHIHAVVKRWMDPNGDGDPSDGIDGWRLDVAEKVNINFWREFRLWVKEINPDAYITGEIWWEGWQQNKMFNAAPWFEGAFDAVMNYRFARAVKKFVIDIEQQISVQAFADTLQSIYRDYPWDNVLVCQNLMDSHDVDRVASQIVNPDRWYDHHANPMQNPDYDVRKPTAQESRKQRLIAGLQMTLPGAPMIYYGDEAGMWGGDDPDCRKPMVWPELLYDSEKTHPRGKPRPADAVIFDRDLFEWYRKLISIRRENPELVNGKVEFFLTDNTRKVLGFFREFEGKAVVILLNNRNEPCPVSLNLETYIPATTILKNLVDGSTAAVSDHLLTFPLVPYEIKILKPADKK
jgi:glycosidase